MLKRNYVLITAITFLLSMSRGALSLGSVYTRSLGASYVAIGALSTLTSVMAIVFAIFWGRATDVLQRRKGFLVVGLSFMALDTLLTSLVPNYLYLFPLRLFDAIATAAYNVSSLALLGDMLSQQKGGRGWRMGAYRGFASVGFAITAFAVKYLLEFTSLRGLYRVAALLMAAALVAAVMLDEERPPSAARRRLGAGEFLRTVARATASSLRDTVSRLTGALRGRSGGDMLADERTATELAAAPSVTLPVAPLLVAALLWSFSFSAIMSLWSNYMTESVGFDQGTVSQLWALAAVVEFPMMILAGWLSDRLGRLPMMAMGFVAWALVFVGYAAVPVLPWIIVVQVLRSFAYSAYTATAMVYATEVRGKAQRGQVSGLQSSAGSIGSIIGGTVSGTITQLAGFVPMISTLVAVTLGGAAYLGQSALKHRARVRRDAAQRDGA